MNRLFLILILLLLIVGMISGCSNTISKDSGKIKNQEQAKETLGNVTEDIDDITSTLDSIDKDLG